MSTSDDRPRAMFCGCTRRPAQRCVRLAPENCSAPRTRPSQLERSIAAYFAVALRARPRRIVSTSLSTGSVTSASSRRTSSAVNVSVLISSWVRSHRSIWSRELQFSKPVSSVARATIRSRSSPSICNAAATKGSSTGIPRSLIAWSSSHMRRSTSGIGQGRSRSAMASSATTSWMLYSSIAFQSSGSDAGVLRGCPVFFSGLQNSRINFLPDDSFWSSFLRPTARPAFSRLAGSARYIACAWVQRHDVGGHGMPSTHAMSCRSKKAFQATLTTALSSSTARVRADSSPLVRSSCHKSAPNLHAIKRIRVDGCRAYAAAPTLIRSARLYVSMSTEQVLVTNNRYRYRRELSGY